MDQMRIQQRNRRLAAQQQPVTADDGLDEGDYDDIWPTRIPSSSRRYQAIAADIHTETGRKPADDRRIAQQRNSPPIASGGYSSVPPRRTATQTSIPALRSNRPNIVHTDEAPPRYRSGRLRARGGSRLHLLFFVGLAMFIMIIGWVAFSALANWWQITQDDLHYGRPRTFQVEAVVGQNDSPSNPSHFIAINLNRHIMIFEIPGGDETKTKIYSGPTLLGDGQDLTPVTLTFKDVNGDGKPDMIVNVQDTHFVYINENGGFRPARPGENLQGL